ncbi:MAG: penicillin-binding transpeptidase domain-containing protein, partial [Anaerolineae bacterium]
MKDTLTRIGIVLAAAFAVVALTLGYWSLVESPTLIARDDNPRRLLAEQRIERGSILDRDGSVLAESTIDPEAGLYERIYPVPAAAPVVGYYSLRFGTSGIEDAFDAFLRGETIRTPEEEAVDTMLGRAPVGGDVRLTLDSDLQQAATTLMAGETGALVLINSETGAILALDSEPLFDPNTLDEEWDALTQDPAAPLLNRATQSLYQPGTILQSVIYGTALDYHVVQLDEAWNGTLSAPVEDALLPCANLPVGVRTLYDAFVHSCPAPLIAIADRL